MKILVNSVNIVPPSLVVAVVVVVAAAVVVASFASGYPYTGYSFVAYFALVHFGAYPVEIAIVPVVAVVAVDDGVIAVGVASFALGTPVGSVT